MTLNPGVQILRHSQARVLNSPALFPDVENLGSMRFRPSNCLESREPLLPVLPSWGLAKRDHDNITPASLVDAFRHFSSPPHNLSYHRPSLQYGKEDEQNS